MYVNSVNAPRFAVYVNLFCAIALMGFEATPVRGADTSVDQSAELSEIVVSAEKREEKLLEVPVAVTVLNPESLAATAQNRLEDYFQTVPGLSYIGGGAGQFQTLAIRGITTGGVGINPTVGITIDDIPFGSSNGLGFGNVTYPDIDPSDLARIEVLRGPQGTLYGSSNIGGLIKFVTVDPDPAHLSGRTEVLTDYVDNGQVGYGFRGAVNIPLTSDVAIRASAFARRDPGYIDNVFSGQSDINQTDVEGGRLSALWKPSSNFSVKLSALVQNTNAQGESIADLNPALQPIDGNHLVSEFLPGGGVSSRQTRFYSLTVSSSIAGANLVSLSGFQTDDFYTTVDWSHAYRNVAPRLYGADVTGAEQLNTIPTTKFTQEMRLTSATGGRVDWLVGLFFSRESSPINQEMDAKVLDTGETAGELFNFYEPFKETQYAAFGDLTIHFTDQFDIQLGARESEDKQTYNETDSGPYFTLIGADYVQPPEALGAHSFTYLVTPRYEISPDLMVYLRAASGYRNGGINIEAQLLETPEAYKPDRTYSYEFGVKGDVLDHLVTFDASIYYIDWHELQINVVAPAPSYNAYLTNAGNAKSQGVELSVQASPTAQTRLSATVSFDDAVLTQTLPVSALVIGNSGDRLPYSSRISGSLQLDQDLIHLGDWTGYAGALFAYVGQRESDFAYTGTQRISLPGYAEGDLHFGARNSAWTTTLFLNNVANRRGIFSVSNTRGSGIDADPYRAAFIQPRTVGLSVARKF